MRPARWLALAALAVAFPVADAQAPAVVPATLDVVVEGTPEPIVPLRGLGQWTVNMTYCYLFPGALAMTATTVTLAIAEAPMWASLIVSPSTVLVPIAQPTEPAAEVCAAPQTAIVYGAVSDEAPLGGSAEITLEAHAAENAPITAADGSTTFKLRVAETAPPPGESGTRDPVSNATRNATLPPSLRDQVIANESMPRDSAEEKRLPSLGVALVLPTAALAARMLAVGKRKR